MLLSACFGFRGSPSLSLVRLGGVVDDAAASSAPLDKETTSVLYPPSAASDPSAASSLTTSSSEESASCSLPRKPPLGGEGIEAADTSPSSSSNDPDGGAWPRKPPWGGLVMASFTRHQLNHATRSGLKDCVQTTRRKCMPPVCKVTEGFWNELEPDHGKPTHLTSHPTVPPPKNGNAPQKRDAPQKKGQSVHAANSA